MASLALSAPRSAFSGFARWTALRPSWSLPCVPSSSSSAIAAPRSSLPATPVAQSSGQSQALDRPTAPWSLSLIPLLDSLAELFPPILLAVPKSKVSHSRKSMRSANKGLKNKTNFSHCEACGMIKLAHNVCPNCYSQISRRWKQEARAGASPAGPSAAASQSVEA